jgi:hypothetical protein
MQRRLAQELLLLGVDNAGRIRGRYPRYDLSLAGAVLLDLALADRIDVQGGRLVVKDSHGVGDAVLDEAVTAIGARNLRVKQWVRRLRKGLRGRLVDQLVASGVLHAEPGRAFGVFPVTRHPVAAPAAVAGLHQRLRAAFDANGPIEPHSAALCGLIRTAGLDRRLFPERSIQDVRRRLDQISLDHYVMDAVRAAIRDIRVAMVAGASAGGAGS